MTVTTPANTLVNDIARQIQAEILSAQLQPGEKLRAARLSERFGVSLSVVREALTRLSENGLVTSRPQLGFAVRRLDADHLRELTEARIAVEGTALGWAIERGDINWEENIVASLYALNRTPTPSPDSTAEDAEAWYKAHKRFHDALVGGCNNSVMLDMRAGLYDATELYRRALRRVTRKSERNVESEHEAIAQAALNRSREEAVSLLERHLQTTTNSVLSSGLADQDASGQTSAAGGK